MISPEIIEEKGVEEIETGLVRHIIEIPQGTRVYIHKKHKYQGMSDESVHQLLLKDYLQSVDELNGQIGLQKEAIKNSIKMLTQPNLGNKKLMVYKIKSHAEEAMAYLIGIEELRDCEDATKRIEDTVKDFISGPHIDLERILRKWNPEYFKSKTPKKPNLKDLKLVTYITGRQPDPYNDPEHIIVDVKFVFDDTPFMTLDYKEGHIREISINREVLERKFEVYH